jgi:antirestriction protein ArdC
MFMIAPDLREFRDSNKSNLRPIPLFIGPIMGWVATRPNAFRNFYQRCSNVARRGSKRLSRSRSCKHWGDEGYAREELVAELGSAFHCADLGLAPEILEDHAAYIDSWLKVLKDDKRFIFTAASHAQRGADYLHGLQNICLEEPETAA